MKYRISLLVIACLTYLTGFSQEDKTLREKYETFKKETRKEYNDFREQCNKEYAKFMREAWKEFQMTPAIPTPKEKPVPPVEFPIKEREKPIDGHPIPFEKIVPPPVVQPQPQPLEPIQLSPLPSRELYPFTFFGTKWEVTLSEEERFRLNDCNENTLANAWLLLSNDRYDALLRDCLSIRTENKLCDWAYLIMLQEIANSFLGKDTNEATLLTAYLYCQSGYKTRLAKTGNHLCLLYSSKHTIYNLACWTIGGEKFYPLTPTEGSLYICPATYPRETPLSLSITQQPLLAKQLSEKRSLQAKGFPEIKASAVTNKNLTDFYNTYPTSMIQDDFGTRWAFYANTPASEEMRQTLYPALKKFVEGKSQKEAGNMLLNFVQTAFEYEYDDKVWGHDRAFFPDEILYYPYCDCEDRSILFSRVIRDIMGLETVLLYYPGHIATAVHFTEEVAGDYLTINGKRYVVCDPTFINAPVGRTMTGMNNSTARVILLE